MEAARAEVAASAAEQVEAKDVQATSVKDQAAVPTSPAKSKPSVADRVLNETQTVPAPAATEPAAKPAPEVTTWASFCAAGLSCAMRCLCVNGIGSLRRQAAGQAR